MRERGVGFVKWTEPMAMAVRMVCCFVDTDTICADPEEVRCGKYGAGDSFSSSFSFSFCCDTRSRASGVDREEVEYILRAVKS